MVYYSAKEDKFWVYDGETIAWFDSSLDAEAFIKQQSLREAALSERKKIVNLLRMDDEHDIADRIEAGEHDQ